jgi:hypothetical protein
MSKKIEPKTEEKETSKKMSARFSKELTDLKDRLEKSKLENTFEKQKDEMQISLLDIAKRMLREILEIPSSFTYEEIEKFVSAHKALDDEGKAHIRLISSLLNDSEFSPKPDYQRIDSMIEGMLIFSSWSSNYDSQKQVIIKRKPNKIANGLWMLLKGTTFIVWGPFYWFFSSIKRFREKNKITEDPAYPIRNELKKANKFYKRKNINAAIASYDKIRILYDKSPVEVKAMVRPQIIALHETIMSDYKNITSKRNKKITNNNEVNS